jgi:hypothetical protein
VNIQNQSESSCLRLQAGTYSGETVVSAGTLQLGNCGKSIAGNVTDNTILTFDRSELLTFRGTGSVPPEQLRVSLLG